MELGQHIHRHYLWVSPIPHAKFFECLQKELQEFYQNSFEILGHILEGTMLVQML